MARILLVDDDLFVLSTMSLGLSRAGYIVEQAESGAEALDMLPGFMPDLAILDMQMPGMTGVELAGILQQEHPALPFLFLSAFDDQAIVQSAIQTGALGYLVKPVTAQQIVPAIEVALTRAVERNALVKDNAELNGVVGRNRVIDTAIGIVMSQYKMERADAFDLIRNYARSHRLKVAEVSEQLVRGGHIALY